MSSKVKFQGKNRRAPITQDWMHWIRTEVVGRKEEFFSNELLTGVRKFVACDTDQREAGEILYWLTKGILAGPKKGSYYSIPSSNGVTRIKAYFFQHPDPSHPRHQMIAPKAKNLTSAKLYQDPSSKAVYLRIIVESQDQVWEGSLAIENGILKLEYPITLRRLLRVLPKENISKD